jgi:hypothetical protein
MPRGASEASTRIVIELSGGAGLQIETEGEKVTRTSQQIINSRTILGNCQCFRRSGVIIQSPFLGRLAFARAG